MSAPVAPQPSGVADNRKRLGRAVVTLAFPPEGVEFLPSELARGEELHPSG